MNGSDDSMVKIIQSLGLDYKPAENSIKSFEARVASLNKQLFDMKANAIQGARDINQAFSSQLGSLGGGKVLFDQWGQPLKTIQTEAAKVGTGVVDGFKPATEALKGHGQTVQDVAKQYSIFGSEMQRRVSWFMTGGLFYGTLKAAKETVQTISEVEMGMIEIARVMDDSTFVFKDYRDELLQLGVQYGQTFDTVQNIALRWAQSGYNVKDSLELTKTSLLALNTAELDAKYATEGMIGIMSQWQLTAEDLLPVIDKINKTADDYAVTSQDLVDGLLRSSGAAKIMNLSIDETISLLTVMREASGRTGREVGNALNSILSYIQRPGSIKVLESMGIRVFADEARTQFRNVMGLFKDIAANWQTTSASIQDGFVQSADDAGLFNEELATALGLQEQWNDLQQRDIAQASAGVYRRNYFIGMIERLANAQDVLNNMMDASGYSIRENERTMEGLAKKYESLKAAAQELAVALGDAGLLDALKGIVDAGTNAAHAFAKMDDNAKALVLTALELVAAVKTLQAVVALFSTKGVIGVASMLPVWGQVAAVIAAVAGAIGLYIYNMNKANALTLEDVNAKRQEFEEVNNLINSYEVLDGKVDKSNKAKDQMLEIQKQLAAIYPEYVDAIDAEGNKLLTNIPLLREIVGLKQQELELKRQELIFESKTALPRLKAQEKRIQKQLDENQKKLTTGDTKRFYPMAPAGVMVKDVTGELLKERQTLLGKLTETRLEMSTYEQVLKSAQGLTIEQEMALLKQRMRSGGATPGTSTTGRGGTGDSGSGVGGGAGTGASAYVNEALQSALRILEHKKRMNQISIQDEITYLNNVKALYVRNADELMDINERIYEAEQRLKDDRLRNSINWINEKKALNELSASEEIAAWERVKNNQVNNIEAVKEATKNLYRLRKQLAEDAFSFEEDTIRHLAKLGIFSIKQQLSAYEELYSVKVESIEEEYRQREKLFELYKNLIDDEKRELKDLYDKRIEAIDDEAERKKKAQQKIIDGIEEELDLINRRESKYDYLQKISNLREELIYWSVRTSEEARKKVIEINKQIDEEEHKREVELQKQKLEDKKKTAKDEIDAIEDAAKEERLKWEKSYKLVENAFDEHSSNIVAAAGVMAKDAYQEWVNNYILPLKQALASEGLDEFEEASGRLEGSTSSMSKNAKIYSLASTILSMKRQYEYGGDKSAEQRAVQYYNELERLSPTVADALHNMNYETARSYINKLPRSHEGSKVLSYGAAYLAPGELIFPADLSTKLEELINVLYMRPIHQGSIKHDNSKLVNIDTLLNVERMQMEDSIDSEILSRDLRRTVIAL